jgi:SAM-dependent methyltransferase
VSRSRAKARSGASSTSGASRRAADDRSSEYSFGDSRRAANRLALVARYFEPTSRAFLEAAAPRGVARALDLGCGPGFTTELLARVCAPRALTGLDASEAFVALARERARHGVDFAVHDVTTLPFPGGAADLIHARLLLAHLRDPEALALRWQGALRPGGRLLLEEVEWIRSDDPVVVRYLELVAGMLRARGQELYVGPRLEAATRAQRRSASRVRELRLSASRAAALFAPNLAEFRTQPAVRALASEAELDLLAAALAERAEGRGGEPVTWALRQLALEA